jgi:hypothetical protein
MEHTEAHGGFGIGLFVFYFGITQKTIGSKYVYAIIMRCLCLHYQREKSPHIEKHASALLVQPRWFM